MDAYFAGADRLYPKGLLPLVRALAGESSKVHDVELRRPGKAVSLELSAAPVLDKQGKVTFVAAVLRDITRHKRAEEMQAKPE